MISFRRSSSLKDGRGTPVLRKVFYTEFVRGEKVFGHRLIDYDKGSI